MKIIYIVKITFLVALSFIITSCDKELDKVNPNSVIVSNFYSNTRDLTSAVNAIYAVLQDPQLVSREWFFVNDLRSDDMATGGGQLETPRYQMLIGTNDNANFVASSFWTGLYGVVHRSNALIQNAPKAVTTSGKDDTLRIRLVAEAKWLRAWAYYELVCNWGSVPLYDSIVKTVNDSKPLAPVADIYASIIGNLTDAIAALPLKYSGSDIGRATKGAARALLARVYMQKGDYASARTQLDQLINVEKQYRLVDNYNDNFMEETEYNPESVFEVGFIDQNGNYGWGYNQGNVQGAETTVHNQEINPTTWGNLIPSLNLLNAFETTQAGDAKTDPRFNYSFYRVGDTIASGPLKASQFNIASSNYQGVEQKIGWRKHTILYKNTQSYYPSGNNERVIRYAEVLLMMAECINETGGTEAEVLPYLNATRNRPSVMMPDYPTTTYPTGTYEERFKAIAHEKRVELAGEEIRNKDILRWREQGKIPSIIPEPISYYSSSHAFLPIPQNEANSNPNIH
jgi:hypothetical protein